MTHPRNTRFVITLAALGLAAGFALPAAAEPSAGARCPHGQHRSSAEAFAQRQQELYDALKLRPDQHAAWSDFAALIQPPAPPEMSPAEIRELPAPERMRLRLERMEARLAETQQQLEAVEAFYELLTAEQRTVFDEQFGPKPHRWGGRKEGATPQKTSGSTGSDRITVI